MKIHEVPDQLKIYDMRVSSGSIFKISGSQKKAIITAQSQFVELENGDVINKSFIVEFKLNFDATRENVVKNKNLLVKI